MLLQFPWFPDVCFCYSVMFQTKNGHHVSCPPQKNGPNLAQTWKTTASQERFSFHQTPRFLVVLKLFSLCCLSPANLKPLLEGSPLDGACFPHEVLRLSKDFFFDAPQILQLCCEREVAAEAPSIGGKVDETIALRL